MIVVFAPMFLLMLGLATLTPNQLTQLASGVTLALSVASVYTWRRSLGVFFAERRDSGIVWLSLGIFTIVVATVFNVGYSLVLRWTHHPLDATNSEFVAVIRFAYSFGFGCIYLVPLTREEPEASSFVVVPPRGWFSLLLIAALACAGVVAGWWFF